jgi:predicted RNA-binding protein (virulence factor B family)
MTLRQDVPFGVSKKTFKKAIGALYKKRLICIERNGIRLIKEGEVYLTA